MGQGDVNWIDLAHYSDRWRALVNAVMNLPGKFLTSSGLVSCSTRCVLHGVS